MLGIRILAYQMVQQIGKTSRGGKRTRGEWIEMGRETSRYESVERKQTSRSRLKPAQIAANDVRVKKNFGCIVEKVHLNSKSIVERERERECSR